MPLISSTANSSGTSSPMPQTASGNNSTALASHGSRTLVVESATSSAMPQIPESGIIRLRGDNSNGQRQRRHVQWTEDTIDNEHMNKKKSKVCCIYRRQRRFDESDSDDESGSSSRDGSGSDAADSPNEYERLPRRQRKHTRNKKNCSGGHDHSV